MSKADRNSLIVYGHFSQPPRGNPLTGEIGDEPDAAPFANWNERIANSAYEPNARMGNFEHISFSFGQPLIAWLKTNRPETYQTIIAADQKAVAEDKGGHALASAYHHSILPLARKRDKRTQILWGIAAFQHHFGRDPLGFWLPEMAVDSETLTLLFEAGIRYVVLAEQQVRNPPPNLNGGPYWITLSRNRRIAAFIRHDRLSSELSFNIHTLGGAGHWCHTALTPALKWSSPLLLLATEGETFGHHYAGEEQFLYWLMTREAPSVGYRTTTLDHFFNRAAPQGTISIEEPSSWSDQHGLANWATGHTGANRNTLWKGALRRALDHVASELDQAYEELARTHDFDPWKLRDRYAPVLLGEMDEGDFTAEFAPSVNAESQAQLAALLRAQELSQRMYNSYTFTGDDLAGRQPRYAIACAAAGLAIAQEATGRFLADRLRSDLAVVTSPSGDLTGTEMLHSVIADYSIPLDMTE